MAVYTITVMGYAPADLLVNPGAIPQPSRVPLAGARLYNAGQLWATADSNGQVQFEPAGTTGCRWTLHVVHEMHHVATVYVWAGAPSAQSLIVNMARIPYTVSLGIFTADWPRGGYILVSTVNWREGAPAFAGAYLDSPGSKTWIGTGLGPGRSHVYSYSHLGPATSGGSVGTSTSGEGVILQAHDAPGGVGEIRLDSFGFVSTDPLDVFTSPYDYGLSGLSALRNTAGGGTNAHAIVFRNNLTLSETPVRTCPLPPLLGGEDPTGPGLLSATMLTDRRKLTAKVNTTTGAITVSRYNAAYPAEAIAATVTVAAANGQAVCVRARRSGLIDLLSVESDTLRHRISRDQGRTWSVPSTITTGAHGCSGVVWETRGLFLAAHYEAANTRWMLKVGTLGPDGVTLTWGTAQPLVTGAKNAGQLLLDSNGTPYFVYLTTGDVETLIRCRSLSRAGVGVWS